MASWAWASPLALSFRESGRRSATMELHRTNWALAAYARSASGARFMPESRIADAAQPVRRSWNRSPMRSRSSASRNSTRTKRALVSAAGSSDRICRRPAMSWSDEKPDGARRHRTGAAQRRALCHPGHDDRPGFRLLEKQGLAPRVAVRPSRCRSRSWARSPGPCCLSSQPRTPSARGNSNLFAQLGEEIGYCDGDRRRTSAIVPGDERAAGGRTAGARASERLARAERIAFLGEFAAALGA